MLWSRSASLMMSTRQSPAMATNILRTVAACWASLESNWRRSSLVTPSTMRATWDPKSSVDDLGGDPGVLDRVVEEGRGHGQGVEAQVGHDPGHGDGVGDVGLPGPAELAQMRLVGGLPGPDDQLPVGGAGAGTEGDVGGQHTPRQVSSIAGRRDGAARRSTVTTYSPYLADRPKRHPRRDPDRVGARAATGVSAPFPPLPLRGRGGEPGGLPAATGARRRRVGRRRRRGRGPRLAGPRVATSSSSSKSASAVVLEHGTVLWRPRAASRRTGAGRPGRGPGRTPRAATGQPAPAMAAAWPASAGPPLRRGSRAAADGDVAGLPLLHPGQHGEAMKIDE